MKDIALLENAVANYDWGSHTLIADLLGAPRSPRHQAELWMGAHEPYPSHVELRDGRVSLIDLIARQPCSVLGRRVSERFDEELPFLFKVLAAERPLSIQAHPDASTARAGFERENSAGLSLDAGERTYVDSHHKPEILCALTPFSALRGFRPAAEVRSSLDRLGAGPLAAELTAALPTRDAKDDAAWLQAFVGGLLRMDAARATEVANAAARAAGILAQEDPIFELVARLHGEYPGDRGVFAPIFLQRVELEPGEAIYLEAGVLHSYLGGLGVELMANSDNVLRGGLTQKRIDVPELLSVLNFEAGPSPVLRPKRRPTGVEVYSTPAAEFELSRIRVDGEAIYPVVNNEERGVEILICTEGRVGVAPTGGSKRVHLKRGASCLVAADVGPYGVEGTGTVFRASVPD